VRDDNVHFQMGFLYTNVSTGYRILRVSTLTLQSGNNVQDIFKLVDTFALSTSLLRSSSMEYFNLQEKMDIDTIKHTFMHTIIILLKQYRCNTNAKSSPSSQLILPDTCQLLPLLLHASFTSPLFIGAGSGISMNTRLEFLNVLLYGLNPMYVFLLFYPTVYGFHHTKMEAISVAADIEDFSDLDAVALLQNDDSYTLHMEKHVIYPSRSNILDTNESYLFDNGYDTIYIYHPPNTTLETKTNLGYELLLKFLREIQLRPRIPQIKNVDSFEHVLFCDDVGLNGQSYEDFLCFLHKRIRLAMQQDS